MKKVLTLEQLKTLIKGVDALDDQQFKEVMMVYPFEDMININTMDSTLLKTQADFLLKLSHKRGFHETLKPIARILEFILAIITDLEIEESGEILSKYFELLKRIVFSTNDNEALRNYIQRGRERILEVLAKTVKRRAFGTTHVSDCTKILSKLLSMSGMLPMTASRNLAEIAEIFKGLKVVHELAVISNIVLKKFSISAEAFNVCITWLLMYGPIFLGEELEEITLKELMTAMNYLYIKYGYIIHTKKHQNSDLVKNLKTFFVNMSNMSDKILIISTKRQLQDEAIRLFSLLLSEYNDEKWNVNMKTIKELPNDIEEWPKSKAVTFLHICGFLCECSRLIWHSSEVLQSIANLIYSYDRFQLSSFTLKTICIIYPLLMFDCPSKRWALLGDELLIMMSRRFYELDIIYTSHISQLCWILQCGDRGLKGHILCCWLRNGGDIELLKKCVIVCRAGTILLRIVADLHVNEDVSDRAILLLNSLQDSALSTVRAMMVCTFYTDRKLLRRLILSNPSVPEDRDSALKICEFMSLLLPIIDDETVFTMGCAYCKNLLVSLKTVPSILKVFCKDIRNIKFLLVKLNNVKDETAVEILSLLKVLVLIQKRNHTLLEDKLVTNFAPSLLGSPNKVEKCLDLLHLVITKKLFIQLSSFEVQSVFLKLFDMYKNPQLSGKCLICMTEILKMNQWLAFISSTNMFIEMNCCLEVMESSWPVFVVFLGCWIKIMMNARSREAVYVAHVGIVRNYLRRVPFLPQTRKALKILKELDKLDSSKIAALL